MASQLETLRIVAPEFASVDDVTVQVMLDLAPLHINAELYPVESRGLALVYQACILLSNRKASETGSTSGTIVREKEGDLERQYSIGASSDGRTYASTYEELLAGLSRGIMGGGITRMADWIPAGL